MQQLCAAFGISAGTAPAADSPTLAGVEADNKQIKEYFSKLKFSFIEIAAKQRLLERLLSGEAEVEQPVAAIAGKDELRGWKQSCAAMQTAAVDQLEGVDAATQQCSNLQAACQQLASRKEELARQVAALQAAASENALTVASLPFPSMAAAVAAKQEKAAALAQADFSAAQSAAKLARLAEEVAAMRQENAELAAKEASVTGQAQAAVAARLSGATLEADALHGWLTGMHAQLLQLFAAPNGTQLKVSADTASAFTQQVSVQDGERRATFAFADSLAVCEWLADNRGIEAYQAAK